MLSRDEDQMRSRGIEGQEAHQLQSNTPLQHATQLLRLLSLCNHNFASRIHLGYTHTRTPLLPFLLRIKQLSCEQGTADQQSAAFLAAWTPFSLLLFLNKTCKLAIFVALQSRSLLEFSATPVAQLRGVSC